MTRHGSGKDADWIRSALEEYESKLIRYAYRITADIDRARDVVQDTFLKLCSADREKVENHLAAWLYTVCRNRALDVYKKENPMNPVTEAELEVFADLAPSPSEAAEKKESASQVLRILETLPAKQKEVVHLKFHQNLSYKEISEITGNTVSYVGVLIHTALKTIRESLPAQPGLATKAGGTK
jgi:RNA polymerase sigma-70 factor (ECF subfamily)